MTEGTQAQNSTGLTRRFWLKAGSLGGLGVLAIPAAEAAQDTAADSRICVTVANHWSYIGIGWQLGIESCARSVVDSLELADRPPGLKTCINLDARAYELLSERYPELVDRLKEYLVAGKVELVGGTYSQPMGSGISGESNIRQIVYGRQAIRRCLDYEMTTFLEEEEFSHPQVPQILAGAGYRYACLAQVDTWGRAGVPVLDLNVFHWQGIDGTSISSTPKNALPYRPPDLYRLAEMSKDYIAGLQKLGRPLLIAWEEFGWDPEDAPRYLSAPKDYLAIPKEFQVEYVTLQEYMRKYGQAPERRIYLNMDSWRKVLFWGIGGDQIRVSGRKIEAKLLAAEAFDAVASGLGSKTMASTLEDAWKDLLTSQSHDVGLCEYSRHQSDTMAPAEPAENFHDVTWGSIGYRHLEQADKLGQSVLGTSLHEIASQVGTRPESRGQFAAIVFNPSSWPTGGVAKTGRVHFGKHRGAHVVVRDSSGNDLPSQLISAEKDAAGNVVVADIAFRAESVPSLGYDTCYIDLVQSPPEPPRTDLRIDMERLELENSYLKVRCDPGCGAMISLVHKETGLELLDAGKSAFPVFRGRPNPIYPAKLYRKYPKHGPGLPDQLDSSTSRAAIQWIERGPLRATLRAVHSWPVFKVETTITLCADSRQVEVGIRMLPGVPPAVDMPTDGGRLPLEIREGYWMTFGPAFPISTIRRDFPFGCEPTVHPSFGALSLVDFEGPQQGLLVVHSGTQYFKRDENGLIWNLLVREWESYWMGEFGWPRYAEYRYALVPHRAGFSTADCMRAAAGFDQDLKVVTLEPKDGPFPKRRSFLSVKPESVRLSALRRVSEHETEMRFVNMDGAAVTAEVKLDIPTPQLVETDLIGQQRQPISTTGGQFRIELAPWKIRTFRC
jgi:alpha-mannosidase